MEKVAAERPPSMDAVIRRLASVEEVLFGAPVSTGSFEGAPPAQATGEGRYSEPSPALAPNEIPSVTGSFERAEYDTATKALGTAATPASLLSVPPSATPEPSVRVAAPRGRSRLVLLGGIVAALAVGGVVVAIVLSRGGAEAVTTTAPSLLPSAPPIAAPAKTSFALTIESIPPGAVVVLGEKELGRTPLSLPIDRASVRDNPRVFTIRADGYEPYMLRQGDSEESVRFLAPLQQKAKTTTPEPVKSGQEGKPRPWPVSAPPRTATTSAPVVAPPPPRPVPSIALTR
jgi:hypothetical protein